MTFYNAVKITLYILAPICSNFFGIRHPHASNYRTVLKR